MGIKVKTDGDMFASLECESVLVEFSKDGDSPACPNSWTWNIYYDGNLLDGTSEELSFSQAVNEAEESLAITMLELHEMKTYLEACVAFGEEGQ